MSQLSLDDASGRAGTVDALSPPETATRSRTRARGSGSEIVRERAAARARELHPDATEIRVNVAHVNGPVVEVYGPRGNACYRFTGFEI